jgi:hypothetical protein
MRCGEQRYTGRDDSIEREWRMEVVMRGGMKGVYKGREGFWLLLLLLRDGDGDGERKKATETS